MISPVVSWISPVVPDSSTLPTSCLLPNSTIAFFLLALFINFGTSSFSSSFSSSAEFIVFSSKNATLFFLCAFFSTFAVLFIFSSFSSVNLVMLLISEAFSTLSSSSSISVKKFMLLI